MFPLNSREKSNCLLSLEEILHFCGYLKCLRIREKTVKVKKMALYMDLQVIIIEFLDLCPGISPSSNRNMYGQSIVQYT